MYKISLHKRVIRFLKYHPELVNRFRKIKGQLEHGNFETLDIKKLNGQTDIYRLRIGKYRFVYILLEDRLLIYFQDADSRGDIY